MTTTTPEIDGRPASADSRARRWRSVHVHLLAERSDIDRFVATAVREACDELVERGEATGWFFIRYWTDGPHVRIRLSDATARAADRLAATMQKAAEAVPVDGERRPGEQDELAHGTVVQPAYEPEYERYGGPGGTAISEVAFCLSSRLVASLMARTDFDRYAVSSTIIDGTLRALIDRGVDPGPWLRRYLFVWHSIRPETREQTTAMIRTELLDNPRVSDRPDLASPATGLASTWASVVDRLLQSLDRPGIGTDDYGGPEILVSHVHMALNRLGLSIQEECQLLVRAIPTTYTSGRSDNAGRDLWKGSSFVEWQPPSPPGHLSPMSRLVDEEEPAGVEGMAWPDLAERHPANSLAGGLMATLDARRSAEAWESDLTSEELDGLLCLAHGPVERGVFDGGSFVVDWAKRGYPSAGMSFPVFARVAVGDVDGLDPGLYEYDPITSRLVPVYPNGGLDLSLLSCGWFLPDELATRPAAVIWLCCDLNRIRPRYGLRALRFSMIEVGHVAQNLVLGSAALGLACRPVGGFFDEAACLAAGVDGGDELPAYAICVGGSATTTRKGVDE